MLSCPGLQQKFIYKAALVYNISLITILHNICERDECTIVTLLKPFKDFVIFQGFLVVQSFHKMIDVQVIVVKDV